MQYQVILNAVTTGAVLISVCRSMKMFMKNWSNEVLFIKTYLPEYMTVSRHGENKYYW